MTLQAAKRAVYNDDLMKSYYQKVNPQLAGYIRAVLVFGDHADIGSPDLPLFTKGVPALLYKINNPVTLFGQSVPDEEWVTENNETVIAFFFKPFALGTIFKLSARDLKEKPFELNLWNTRKARTLDVQLNHSRSVPEKTEILSHFIFTQIQSNRRDCELIRYATDTLMQHSNANALSRLLKDLNLTERTFQRIFKKYVGITANEYRRVCQHYFAFTQLKGGHFDKLTDVVYANGYFDQSHYIRSFKEFTGITPNEYLQSGLSQET